MDRNKGIWITIVCILVVGIMVTMSTSRFVTSKEQSLASTALETSKAAMQKERTVSEPTQLVTTAAETSQESDGSVATEAASVLTETMAASEDGVAGNAELAPQAVMAGEGDSPVAPIGDQVEQESETVQSPLKNSKLLDVSLAEDTQDLGTYYKKRLEELDVQIQKMKDSDTESTTYSMKSNSEKELKLWDNELNVIYNEILSTSDEADSSQLVEEERQWMKMRDAAALEASQKYSGGTLEGLEYTSTLASYTRDRAYDLVETFLVKSEE